MCDCGRTGKYYEGDVPPGRFRDQADIAPIEDLGLTIPNIEFHTYYNQVYRKVPLASSSFCAPQFYKGDYRKFPMKPREAQLTTAGMTFYPLIGGNRTIPPGEEYDTKEIRNSVFVRRFHIKQGEVHNQLVSKYWPVKKRKEALTAETAQKGFWRRMGSRFGGLSFSEEKGVYLPKGELYNNETRIQNPEQAMDMWDTRYNKEHAKSLGLAVSQSASGAW